MAHLVEGVHGRPRVVVAGDGADPGQLKFRDAESLGDVGGDGGGDGGGGGVAPLGLGPARVRNALSLIAGVA